MCLKNKKMNNKIKTLLTLLLFSFLTFSQVKLEVKAEKTNLKIGEVIQVNYIFNEEGSNFTPPNFNGFNKGVRMFLLMRNT